VEIEQQLATLQSPFSYADTGMSRDPDETTLATAYRNFDRYEVMLGHGEAVFLRAKDAMRDWLHFPVWVQIVYPYPVFEPQRPVGILVRVLGVYSLNCARIVYHIGEAHRFGFASGTTTHHEETGEERFLIEWRPEDDSVWYSIVAFSSPQTFLATLGYPYARRMQRRFGRDSLVAMQRAVADLNR
jgi:uncharacterized protein (UPF0548 family)